MKTVKELAAHVKTWLPKSEATRTLLLSTAGFSIALLLLPVFFHLDGKAHADWEQFLGRFHPLAVHLPIGFLLLVPVLEYAARTKPALKEASDFVLTLAFAACLGSLLLGYMLAYGAGDAGEGVTRHMWGGIVLTVVTLVCLLARPAWASGAQPFAYPALMVCMLAVLTFTAHQGGSLTHGSNYLTAYMPAPLKRLLPMGPAGAPTASSFYAKHINPILDENCVACHGEGKVKGGLRLDSYAAVMRGGADGPAVVPGDVARSLLLVRITLPPDHKQFMPAEGKPPLKPEEIAWIRAWIQQGASPTATTLAGISIREASPDPPLQPVGDYSALMPDIRQMEQGQGAKLIPVSSKPSDGLILSTVNISANFNDAQLAQFLKFAPYLVEAELGRTAITNASFDTLAKFTHLRALHLEGTAITGEGLAKLAPLTQLTYLNLSGTKVSQASLAPLNSMKNLRHIYLYNTPAQPAFVAETK